MGLLNKKWICLNVCFIIFIQSIAAQQNHFIYLQTENNQPFYIKWSKKVLSSSASGYLIIPKLQDGNYDLVIGFPKNEWPEQNISCVISNKDAGFILKNFGNNTWGLFNLQTMEIINATPKSIENLQKIINKDSIVISDSLKAINRNESQTVNINVEPQPQLEKSIADTLKNTISVKRIMATDSNEGSERIYIDKVDDKWDTVRIFIPVEEIKIFNKPVEILKGSVKQLDNKLEKTDDITEVKTKVITDTFSNPLNKRVKDENQPEIKNVIIDTIPSTTKTVLPNSDCRNLASEDDFYKLRKKMAAETGTDGMVNAAKKIFKSKCFTTEQIKNLSLLFLSDEGRYKFYDAAYPFVTDTYNYSALEVLLKDNYFKVRFKAMLRH